MTGTPRRVVHVSPSYFSDDSIIGGGERYATRLASAMADMVDTTLVSFGPRRRSMSIGRLKVEIYPIIRFVNGVPFDPLSFRFIASLVGTEVIHCYQFPTAVTSFAVLAGTALGKKLFVTDLGGAASDIGVGKAAPDFIECKLPISRFGERTFLPGARRSRVIYAGVDPQLLDARGEPKVDKQTVLFVGRLLPHKGVDCLIRAVDAGTPVDVVGRAYDSRYLKHLEQLAAGKRIRFITNATDAYLADAYRNALVTVLPSVYTDMYGNRYEKPELLGLVLLESMACGTPVICTDVGGMPEFVEQGVTGFIVPPNDPDALRQSIRAMADDRERTSRMGTRGREVVQSRYTWPVVARRCLEAYRGEC